MNGSKYSKILRPWSGKGLIRNRRNLFGGQLIRLDYSVTTLIMLAGISGLMIMLCRVACHGYSDLMPRSGGWDRQREVWMEQHPSLGTQKGERPRIMMVTGASPVTCESAASAHAILQSAKNKLDYSRLHDIQLYYSLGNPYPDPKLTADWWATLPIIRMLMLQHPEVEWMWWVDADAVFTDMTLEPPFADMADYNLVLFREDRKEKTGLHTGNYLIRNCQWSLDLIQAWGFASAWPADYNLYSTKSASDLADGENGKIRFDIRLSVVVTSQRYSPQKETENWAIVAPKLEGLQVQQQQKLGHGVPLLTHFAGCLPCSTAPSDQVQIPSSTHLQPQRDRERVCLQQLDRTFDFSDNQVYDRYGFQQRALGSSKMEALTKHTTEDGAAATDADLEKFSLLPRVTDWDEQRRAHLEKSAVPAPTDKVVLVSGSSPKPCDRAIGDQMLLRGLKNKIDYSRLHGIEFFYNMAVIDKDLTGWWSKLPLLRMLMLNNPEVEWFWWMDSDAVITDMDFQIPFDSRYNGNGSYNLVLYGNEDFLYEEKTYNSINTGNFFIRNCQWSIDLLNRWASFGIGDELQIKTGEFLSNFLKERPSNWQADDQSVLVYILLMERERWSSKVMLENAEIDMSATWSYWTPRFLDNVRLTYKPFVTHFAGCTPCGGKVSEECLAEMDRAYNFADNQVLESLGLCHDNLRSQKIISSCTMGSEAI